MISLKGIYQKPGMAYNTELADRVRLFLADIPKIRVEEKVMFSGLAFMVNGKMCINVSNDNLMCRFDPKHEQDVAERNGFLPMLMKGRQLPGYCYVSEVGYKSNAQFEFWMNLCLDYNPKAKASKKKKAPTTKKAKSK